MFAPLLGKFFYTFIVQNNQDIWCPPEHFLANLAETLRLLYILVLVPAILYFLYDNKTHPKRTTTIVHFYFVTTVCHTEVRKIPLFFCVLSNQVAYF